MRGQSGTTVFLKKSCLTCLKEFLTPDTLSRKNRRWCSVVCANRHGEKKEAGARNIRSITNFFDIKFNGTIRRILKELDAGCSRCGWKEGTCDLHHINGKKVENANGDWNISVLCPNCHRLFHEKKLMQSDIKSIKEQIGEAWKKLYYG